MDTVGRQGPSVEHPQFFHQGNGALAVLFPAVRHFPGGFRKMHVDLRSQFPGPGDDGFQIIRAAGVGGMRTEHHGDPSVLGPVPGLVQLRVLLQTGGPVCHAAARETPGQYCPDAAVRCSLGSFFHKEIHVGETGGAGADHFRDSQQAPPVHRPAVQSGFQGPDPVLEPVHQGHVVGITAEQGHGHMGMGVHPPGHRQVVPSVDHFPACHRFCAHIPDGAAVDPDVEQGPVPGICQLHILQYDIIYHVQRHSSFLSPPKASSRKPPYSSRAWAQWQLWVKGPSSCT